MTKFVALAICCALLAYAQKPPVTKTETADFPAGGTLRIDKSVGELWIEGWDQPGFEITTTKSVVPDESANLDDVHVTFAREGGEMIVRTDYSHRFGHSRKVNLQYRIRVPRAAAVAINHHTGEVHIDDMVGNVNATVGNGLIAMRLPSDRDPSIDAKSQWGGVISDFGKASPKWKPFAPSTMPFGHRLEDPASNAQQKLYLRTGFGDILIIKEDNPKLPVS